MQQAVPFGNLIDNVRDDNRAYPYLYNFVDRTDDPNTVMGGIGPTIPALTYVKHIIRMREDFTYLPRWIRYTVYYLNPGPGTFEWFDTTPPPSPALYANRMSYGDPLYRLVSIDMAWQPDDRVVMGNPSGALGSTISIPLELQSGIDSGMLGVKVPYMLPAMGNIVLTIHNNHATKALTVGGCIFGWKARL